MKNGGGQTQPGARKVVIVVEDEPTIGALIAEAISDEPGYCAIHVNGPAAALETTKHVTPDVMVVDVRLPGMSGFDLYDRLKKIRAPAGCRCCSRPQTRRRTSASSEGAGSRLTSRSRSTST